MKESQPITIAVAGIGGYGNGYVAGLLDAPEPSGVRFIAAVDPAPESCRRLDDLQARQIPVLPSLAALYADHRPDLLVVCTPLHWHADHTCQALAAGSHVLCEKPLCVTPQQVRQMIQARDAASRHVAVGYQWSFSGAIQELKGDILAGRLGRPRRLRTLVLWPRDETYYTRNRWAGRQRDDRGNWVLDSPVNNACAHYLHNMLYVLGPRPDRSAHPERLSAELYRAHPIENYDTAVLRGTTRDGVELLLVTSHATDAVVNPSFSYEFEKATVEFAQDAEGQGPITARFADGSVRNYGSPVESRDRKVWLTVDAIGRGEPSVCGIEAAVPHTLCGWTAQQCVREIAVFSPSRVRVAGEAGRRRTWVEGLAPELIRCYDQFALPSELGFDWAVAGKELPVEDPLAPGRVGTALSAS